jgi:hypothetical protein
VLLRLAGGAWVLVEQHDEWEAGDRRYSEASMLELKNMNNPTDT